MNGIWTLPMSETTRQVLVNLTREWQHVPYNKRTCVLKLIRYRLVERNAQTGQFRLTRGGANKQFEVW